jgi:hypothetical protein
MPFYLAACVAASLRWWFVTGVCVVVGAMFKGQMLLAAPALLLWPVFGGDWRGTITVVGGSLFGLAGVTAPWLLRTPEAMTQLAWTLVAATLLLQFRRRSDTHYAEAALACGVMVFSPWLLQGDASPFALSWLGAAWMGLLLARGYVPAVASGVAVGVVVGMIVMRAWTTWGGVADAVPPMIVVFLLGLLWLGGRLVRPRGMVPWALTVVAAGVVFAGLRFGGSFNWYEVGFRFGTDNYLHMQLGGASNLAAILGTRYGWGAVADVSPNVPSAVVDWLGTGGALTMRTLLRAVYVVLIVLCGFGLATHARRKDARVLVALAVPWVVSFAVLAQMHERYLLWGAVMTASVVGVSFGLTLVHLFVTFAASAMIAQNLFNQNPGHWPAMHRFLNGTHPDLGWGVVLAAVLLLYITVVPRRRDQPATHGPASSDGRSAACTAPPTAINNAAAATS